jgi:hypothetical protein
VCCNSETKRLASSPEERLERLVGCTGVLRSCCVQVQLTLRYSEIVGYSQGMQLLIPVAKDIIRHDVM